MPLVDIHVIAGVFDDAQKALMIKQITDVMVGIEGENLRGVTWVKINECKSGDWAIGGNPLSTQDVMNLQKG